MPDEPRYTISCEGLVIGHATLQPRSASRAVLCGVFAPTESYAAVAPLFHAEAVVRARPADGSDGEAVLRAFYTARDRLRFRVLDPAGGELAVEYLHVYESAAGEEGPLEVLVRLATAALRR